MLCVAGWLASTAAACHSEISASIDCNGVVSYTANAWNEAGATTAERTNSNVQVSASSDGRTFSPVASGHFGRDNNFSFGGTFSAGSASTVWVKVQELANWGNGEAPAAARIVQVTKSGCGTSGGGTCPSADMVRPSGPITISGGVATVRFTVANGCSNIELSLVSYKAPGPTFSEETASQQVKYASQTKTFSAGSGELTVAVPDCYYQVDFVYGKPIDQLGPAGSNNFYGKQGRLISALNGGTAGCTTTPTPPVVSMAVEKLERVGSTASFVAGPVAATVGQTIEYQINVRNTGNVMLWVTITDQLCDTGTLSSPSGQGVGPTGVVSFTCTHVARASDVGSLTNTVFATGVAGNGASVTGTATAVAQVTAAATTGTSAGAGGVAGATHTVHKATAKKKAAKKSVRHAAKRKTAHHAVKAAHHKKVTKKAKPAKAVVRGAHYTG
jgi:uncharacterized repeat protein (TIGR01451 family)